MIELAPGTVVADRYVVDGVVGSGGMAVVYRVQHNKLGSIHALKLIRIPHPKVRSRLMQEGRVQAELHHTNIVAVTDQVEVDGLPGLIMEFVRGPSLAALLQRRPLTLEQVDILAQGILAGVEEAHRHGVTHRDLKPANIMLEVGADALTPKVTDFGLAKVLAGERSGLSTRSGIALGTPSYMAPEQVRDAKNVDRRADVWSLGAVLYEMICSKLAFGGKDTFDIFRRIDVGRFRSIRKIIPGVPDRMEHAVQAALTVDVEQRAQTVQELLDIWMGRKKKARGPWTDSALRNAGEIAPQPAPLAALAAVVHKTMGDTWADPDVAPGSGPPRSARRADEIKTLQLEDHNLQGIEPVPLVEPDAASVTEYEGEQTVVHRIRREYGIVAAASAVALTALTIIFVGLAVLWGILSFLEGDEVKPTGPSLDETLEAPE